MIRRKLLPIVIISSIAGLCPAGGSRATDLLPGDLQSEIASPDQMPAVDGINVKLDGFGGAYSDGGIAGAAGAVSIPLGFRFGTQIDGVAAQLDDEFFGSISDHLFWRDPSHGLLGLYGSYSHYEGFGGVDEYHAAIEGELYLSSITLRGLAGVEGGDTGPATIDGVPFDYEVETRFFDKLDLIFYPTDNLQLFAGHRYTGGLHAAAAGAEYLWGSDGGTAASTFVEGRISEDDNGAVWGGVRLYFGRSDKSLIRRHREDEPALWEPDTHFGVAAKLDQTQGTAPPVVDQCNSGANRSVINSPQSRC